MNDDDLAYVSAVELVRRIGTGTCPRSTSCRRLSPASRP